MRGLAQKPSTSQSVSSSSRHNVCQTCVWRAVRSSPAAGSPSRAIQRATLTDDNAPSVLVAEQSNGWLQTQNIQSAQQFRSAIESNQDSPALSATDLTECYRWILDNAEKSTAEIFGLRKRHVDPNNPDDAVPASLYALDKIAMSAKIDSFAQGVVLLGTRVEVWRQICPDIDCRDLVDSWAEQLSCEDMAADATEEQLGDVMASMGWLRLRNLNLLRTVSFQVLKRADGDNERSILEWVQSEGDNVKPIERHIGGDRLSRFSPTDISRITWSLSRVKYGFYDLVDLLANDLQRRHREDGFRSFTTHELCNCVWGLAKLGAVETARTTQVALCATREILATKTSDAAAGWYTLQDMDSADLAIMMRGLAFLNGAADDVLHTCVPFAFKRELAEQLDAFVSELQNRARKQKLQNFGPSDLTNIVFALAFSKPQEMRLVSLIAAEISRRTSVTDDSGYLLFSHFQPIDLSDLLWAFGALKFKHEPILRAITSEVQRWHQYSAIANVDSVLLQNLVWGMEEVTGEKTYKDLPDYHKAVVGWIESEIEQRMIAAGLRCSRSPHVCLALLNIVELRKWEAQNVPKSTFESKMDLGYTCTAVYGYPYVRYDTSDLIGSSAIATVGQL